MDPEHSDADVFPLHFRLNAIGCKTASECYLHIAVHAVTDREPEEIVSVGWESRAGRLEYTPKVAVRQRAHAAVRQDRSRGVRVNVVAVESS